MLIVGLSWVNFWIDVEAVAARISLALLSVLTMTTQSSGIQNQLAKVSYIKGIDIWMSTCMGFVVCGLLEYALVNVLSRVDRKRRKGRLLAASSSVRTTSAATNNNELAPTEKETSRESTTTIEGTEVPRMTKLAKRCDKISRALFPLLFIFFNLFYWMKFK